MSTQPREQQARSDWSTGLWPLLVGVTAGPLAWTVHLLVAYYFVGVTCAIGLEFLIHLTTLVTLGAAAAGGYLSYRQFQRPDLTDGMRFAAVAGVLLSVLFAFAIFMEGLPAFSLGPCGNG